LNSDLLAFGSAVLDECLLNAGLNVENCQIGKSFNIEQGTYFVFNRRKKHKILFRFSEIT